MTTLEWARKYVAMGWQVFPLVEGSKLPATKHGFKDATRDEELLVQWWSKSKQGIAVATGSGSGLLVLDIDPRNGGDDTLAGLEKLHGKLPATRASRTGGGGSQKFFRFPGGRSKIAGANGLFPGIDIKCDGGYVVLPPSKHPSGGRYSWVGEHEIAEVPAWLLDALDAQSRPGRSVAAKAVGERIIPEGSRNKELARVAGQMQRFGMDPETILDAVLRENEKKCQPPLAEDEVVALVASITHYAPDNSVILGIDSEVAKGANPVELAPLAEWLLVDPPEPEWIIEGRLAKGHVAVLAAPAYHGKSWMAGEIAMAGVTGRKVLGLWDAPGLSKVLWVDEENSADEAWRRIRALSKGHGITPDELKGKLFMTAPLQGFSWRSKDMGYGMLKRVEELQPDLVIFDSLIATSNIKDENNSVEIRRFFHECVQPVRAVCGSAVLFIHHSNKDALKNPEFQQYSGMGQMRGSSDFPAAPDVVLMIHPAREKGWLVLRTDKMRRGKPAPPVAFQIKDLDSGGVRVVGRDVTEEEAEPGDPTVSQQVRDYILDSLKTPQDADGLRDSVRLAFPEVPAGTLRQIWRRLRHSGEIEESEGIMKLS